ncbi:DMT family transporter [Pseudodonghicola flavimaris]|uniref:DMT family transporter n=1 Tax=Pseudodonghicola flavimaris TaxID=3050036 RepID=A0ABT7EY55_9RHOB|nr:DMT family transporter [Pseudodonghicola flavimaris]MDK3017268.1 DMT family transporter [Pseudodonghicola flavimaris]
MSTAALLRSPAGILFILVGVLGISVNDVLIKLLSGGYPLHQVVLTRSLIGLVFILFMVRIEGGWSILKTRQPILHAMRGLLVVFSNMTYFVALAVLPLADATALFFVAPLFITALSIPILGEKVGPLRIAAVTAGFAGVVIMQRPWADSGTLQADRLVMLLPVLSAFAYALMQIMTRKLGASTKASALAVYIQIIFILVSLGFFAVAGDGRFAEGSSDPSVQFLLRAWIWPDPGDLWLLLGLGAVTAVAGYCLSQAYRLTDAATVAPFEYVGLPLSVLWGWLFWSELPSSEVWIGIALIMGSGLFVFLREKQKARRVARAGVKRRF